MKRNVRGETGGSATDFYGISYHGQATTHLDALCHVWEGIITRSVLLDVPKFRGQPFVTQENRYEFMLTVNPLRVVGGTGSPVNPIALF